jgi:hypothetical protein
MKRIYVCIGIVVLLLAAAFYSSFRVQQFAEDISDDIDTAMEDIRNSDLTGARQALAEGAELCDTMREGMNHLLRTQDFTELEAALRAADGHLELNAPEEAFDEEHLTDSKGKEDVRTVLHLHPALAPYKCAVLPLSKKLGDKAMEIRNELSKYFMVDYDDTGSIGKRYRREDEIGTPFCITVDFDTVGDEAKGIAADNCVTVRDRDTMEQVRMPISELKSYIESKIEF